MQRLSFVLGFSQHWRDLATFMHIPCMAYIGLEIKHKELIGLELVDVAE
jgi:hypothetical protein